MIQNQQFKFIKHMIFQSQDIILTAQISEKGKFLAIGGNAGKIQIFYLQSKKLIKNIQLDCEVNIIIFSKDSNILFSGDAKGYLHGYDFMNNFKLIYKDKVHQRGIQDMMIIDDNEILICSNYSIQITNVKLKQQLLNILNSISCLEAVEYDKSREWIIYSDDNIINFVNRKDGKVQIQYQSPHIFIEQIQLFSNGLNLLSACRYDLYFWQIDFHNLTLIKVNQISRHFVSNFTSILNNNRLVLIDDKHLYITYNDLVVILQINHNIKEFLYYFRTRQINLFNYFIVPGEKILQVLKRR